MSHYRPQSLSEKRLLKIMDEIKNQILGARAKSNRPRNKKKNLTKKH